MAENGQQRQRSAVWAGLIGAGAVVAVVAGQFGCSLLALTIGMPTDMGGLGWGPAAWIVYYAGLILLLVLVGWCAIRLAKRAGIIHPARVVGLGSGLTVCGGVALTQGLRGAGDGSDWAGIAITVALAAAMFACVARWCGSVRVLIGLSASTVVLLMLAMVRNPLLDQQDQREREELVLRSRARAWDALTAEPHVLAEWHVNSLEIRDNSLLITQSSPENPSVTVEVTAFRERLPADLECRSNKSCSLDGDLMIWRDTETGKISSVGRIDPGYRVSVARLSPISDQDLLQLVRQVRPATPEEKTRFRAEVMAGHV